MRPLFLIAVLMASPAAAQTGVTIATRYEVALPTPLKPGAWQPWPGADEFSMNGVAFKIEHMPPCGKPWELHPDALRPGSYGTVVVVDPLPAGATLWAVGAGGERRLGTQGATWTWVCPQ